MIAAENSSPPPELVRLGQILGLSSFERHILLLCAAMELDPQMGTLCAHAQNDPGLAYPTFSLALSALPEPAWDALSPYHGLRWWRLIEVSQLTGQPLVTSGLRADERIVNFLKGLNELDERLEPLLTPLQAAPGELPASQQAPVRAAMDLWSTGSLARPPASRPRQPEQATGGRRGGSPHGRAVVPHASGGPAGAGRRPGDTGTAVVA